MEKHSISTFSDSIINTSNDVEKAFESLSIFLEDVIENNHIETEGGLPPQSALAILNLTQKGMIAIRKDAKKILEITSQ